MTKCVIQGFFPGGRVKLAPTVAMTVQPKAGPRPPGPPVPAFVSRAPVVQLRGAADSFAVDPRRLGLVAGGGKHLPNAVRGQMEAALGADFSAVRVHVGPQAERIGAVAFTMGNDLYFAPGRFQPDTMQGKQLLGHELAHVVQQRAGRVRNPLGAGVAVVQDRALEAEAERLGYRAAAYRVTAQPKSTCRCMPDETRGVRGGTTGAAQRRVRGAMPTGKAAAIQALFEGDWWHNQRKVGVEITEGTAGNNRILEAAPTAAWNMLGLHAKSALWTHTVNLPDRTGTAHIWQAADYNTMGAYFLQGNGAKGRWMKWNEVVMTEDYGEFEWIIEHPNAPQPVSEYRRRLTAVNSSRATMRNAIATLGYNPVILSMTPNGAVGEVFVLNLQAVNAVSSQITIEITDRKTALKAFQEGLTYGLNRLDNPNKLAFAAADREIKTAISTAAGRINLQGVTKELLAAYIVADLCHKMATATTGAVWAGDVASNFKGWRVLFPKSHPYQVLLMSVEGNPTVPDIARIKQQLLVARTRIVDDCKSLFVTKLLKRQPQLLWNPDGATVGFYSARADFQNLQQDFIVGAPATSHGARIGDLNSLLNAYTPNFLVTAYNETVDALTDSTLAASDVVRSGGFAVHTAHQKAFAFEDRGEVQDSFPNLNATYERIVKLIDRY